MAMQLIAFDAARIDATDVEVRSSNHMQLKELEHFPEATAGSWCITGLYEVSDGQDTRNSLGWALGMWDADGNPLSSTMPTLSMWAEVREPNWAEAWVNIYRSDQTAHGFTVGEKTGTEEEMRERGARNKSGNYIDTIKLRVDLNKR